ncbi:MAG: NBR1-Ig-like domain-containing protein, partial [Armatimonadota bacterium]|nr:NBR1-Ig-like domain-containing protein [Armatimonadota bacterium]
KAPQQNVWDASGATLLADQPINGAGPWFSCLRPEWHRQQFTDLRRAGIDVALLRCQKNDPLLGRELDALVEALQELKAHKQDYPLVGVDLAGSTAAADDIFAHIPPEFRAFVADAQGQNPGLVAYTGATHDPDKLTDGTPLTFLADGVSMVSPGRVDKSALIGRAAGHTYADSWQKAIDGKDEFVLIDSWNDFSHGTEICASRQYGEKYADDTRLLSNAFNGSKEWHAKYLTERTPRTVRPKTLYEVPVRLVNAGTLPWRAGEGYALAPRWYKDGRLFDDSAPRIPVGTDVLPGQAITLGVGLVARNQYGDDLEPGKYTLVFDMVQNQDRWFSYAGDIPLQVPVTVTAPTDTTPAQATFISALTPAAGQTGAAYPVQVAVRNDGGAPWNGDLLAYKIQTVAPDGSAVQTLAESDGQPLSAVQPGQIANSDAHVLLAASGGKPLPPGDYRLHWFIKPGGSDGPIAGAYDTPLRVVTADPGASFVLSDVPRALSPGKEYTAKLGIQNAGPSAWPKGTKSVGCHWYYLDGTEAQWDGNAQVALPKDVPTDGVTAVNVKFRTPDLPGRYALVWDMRNADGTWDSTAPASQGNDLLQILVSVGPKGDAAPVDLSRYADTGGDANDFDGQGHGLPSEMLPPDATAEVDANPLLLAKPGPPLYPSGFYAQRTGDDWTGNHRVSFLYPAPRQGASSVVTCHGQTIDLPGGNYTAIHLLAAAVGGSPVTADFGFGSGHQTVTIADWTQTPTGAGATIGFRSPYRIGKNGPEAVPVTLGDYALSVGAAGKTSSLTLPNNPAIKILAVSLEK